MVTGLQDQPCCPPTEPRVPPATHCGGRPYPLDSCHFPARADPPSIGALDGGHGEADEEKHLALLQAGRQRVSPALSLGAWGGAGARGRVAGNTGFLGGN